jgi:hypothetical protein
MTILTVLKNVAPEKVFTTLVVKSPPVGIMALYSRRLSKVLPGEDYNDEV